MGVLVFVCLFVCLFVCVCMSLTFISEFAAMRATSLFPTLLSSMASREKPSLCGRVFVCVCGWVSGCVSVCLCVHVCVGGGGGKEEGETYIQQQLHSERGENEVRRETCRRNHCI